MNSFKLEKTSPHVDIKVFATIAIFCWFILKYRNEVVFCNEKCCPFKIVFDSCRLLYDLSENVERVAEGLSMAANSFWSPHLSGLVKLNFDGSFLVDNGTTSDSVVFRKEDISFLYALAESGMVGLVEVVECWAMHIGFLKA